MQLEQQFGTNPYKFGMIGSTDAHNSLATTREENFFGKASHLEPEKDRWEHEIIRSLSGDPKLTSYSYESIGAGLAAVWARENTREGIFNAMQKKEAYATTGTRIVVRFFGGWNYKMSTDPMSSLSAIAKVCRWVVTWRRCPMAKRRPPSWSAQ
jgi:hypothetical protein